MNGLTQSEHRLLATLMLNLDDEHTALSVTEVSNLLQITPAGVTHLANSLEKAGYIERLSAPNDRRLVLVGLTDRGRKAAEALIADVQAQLSGLLNHLGEDDGQAFMRLIARAIDYFESQFEA
ncbi:MAG: MarR family transcriptional regulator [Caldilineaceae bacterium]|nr:MarR family transcriptional regulator [Caldilineaceae bacterium]MCB9138558.1 MarR family transcriptional regulator [Caldilineaceae bacterium]